jgi:hypothetical protein
VYYVTRFVDWERRKGGSLPFIDGIADVDTATSGILKLKVRFVAAGGSPQFNGKLTIFCNLPGTINPVSEGIAVKIPSLGLNFDEQVSGVTLFHILR